LLYTAMEDEKKEKILKVFLYFLAFSPFFLMPLENPDIFWHLSSGKHLLEKREFLTTEIFSWTLAGTPWRNFEWLTQVLYYLLYSLGGFSAIAAFKALIFSAAALIFRKTLSTAGAKSPVFFLPFLTVAVISVVDARADNLTLLGFAFLFDRIQLLAEKGSGMFSRFSARNIFLTALLFALWANLHAGFVYGIFLMLAYSVSLLTAGGGAAGKEKSRKLLFFSLTGAAAALANPLGWRLYSVILTHMRESGAYKADIAEWQSLSPLNAHQLPLFLLLSALLILAAAAYFRRKRTDWANLAPALVFFAAAAKHARLAPFFGITALLFAAKELERTFDGFEKRNPTTRLPENGLSEPEAGGNQNGGIIPPLPEDILLPPARDRGFIEWGKKAFLLFFFALPVFYYSLYLIPQFKRENFYRFRSEGLVSFLNANEKELSGLKLYNPYHCGGWLSFETGGKYRIFMDGRYLFSGLLAEFSSALRTPEAWNAFLKKYGIELAVIENLNQTFRQETGPGSPVLERPFYLNLFPEKDWALVYWDGKYLLFADRKKLGKERASAMEFEHFRANDFEAAEYAVKTGSLNPEKLKKEAEKYFRANPALAEGEKKIFRDWLENMKKAAEKPR